MDTLTGMRLRSPICNKLQCSVFWNLFIGTSIKSLSNFHYSSSAGSDTMGQPFLLTCINEHWTPLTPSLVHQLSFLGLLLVSPGNRRAGTSQNSCICSMIQLSRHHNLTLGKITQSLMLDHFFCFQHINSKDRMFTSCLIYPTQCQVPLWWTHHQSKCFSGLVYIQKIS